MNISLPLLDMPVEFINITEINPLISHVQIKVLYVQDTPNRNGTVITKDEADQIAQTLPGSPIVGFFNKETGDFEGHERVVNFEDGQFRMESTTRPYGFVDLNAKVWYQWFDDNGTPHQYLMTEGYLWTGQYPECQRVVDKGNNQSLEFDDKTFGGLWAKGDNGNKEFFIINEAIISKLCILGENKEPCFEGASITAYSFEDFKQQAVSLISEMKEILNKGGSPVYTTYAVEIGDALWQGIWNILYQPGRDENPYSVEGVYEEGDQKFAIIQNRKDQSYYRMNFSLTEAEGLVPDVNFIEVTKQFVEAEAPAQFAPEAVAAYEAGYKAGLAHEAPAQEEEAVTEEPAAQAEESGETGSVEYEAASAEEEPEVAEEPSVAYNLEDVTEYQELLGQYNTLNTNYEALKAELENLREFKASIDKEKKQKMVDSFYMLSDEQKKDVVDHLDTYSLDDIEAKLSIICFRNKVNFNLDDSGAAAPAAVTYELGDSDTDTDMPAWVKAVIETQNTL